MYDAFNSGDLEGAISKMSPDIEFAELDTLPGSATHRGHDGVRAFEAKLADALEDLRYEATEMIPSGDHIMVALEVRGRGRESGLPVNLPMFSVWTVREGRLCRHRGFAERSAAIEASGLSGA